MADWLLVTLLALGAGVTMPIGAAIAGVERVHPAWLDTELRHGIIAFGGGALLAAVALVLVPEGLKALSLVPAAVAFSCGAFVFMGLDILLARRRTAAGQLVAMLADFLPEALALGATAALHGEGVVLLALIIALQNLPEGFNACRELRQSTHFGPLRVSAAFALTSLLGPLFALTGYFFLADSDAAVAGIMLFAAGGILYLTFQDIAPQARLENHWAPPLGANLGFLLGIVGKLLS
jgi:ZIP family zinc transporter